MKFKDLEEAMEYVDDMEPMGECYTIEEVREMAEYYEIPISTDKYDENDLYVAINMVENDYGEISDLDEETKVEIAEKFLSDIDAPAGKMKTYLDAMYNAKNNSEDNAEDKEEKGE